MAKAATPSYADLSAQVNDLQAQMDAVNSQMAGTQHEAAVASKSALDIAIGEIEKQDVLLVETSALSQTKVQIQAILGTLRSYASSMEYLATTTAPPTPVVELAPTE